MTHETCTIDDCERKVRYRTPQTLCYMHYKRFWRKGNFEKDWYKPYVSPGGYYRIAVPGECRRVFLHRKIMEEHLNRPLTDTEKIHHINGNKLDNRIENLVVTSQSEHMSKYHLGHAKKLHTYNKQHKH